MQTSESVSLAAAEAIRKASDSLLKKQTAGGFWWADLRADSTLESDFILMELWLHPPVDGIWNPPIVRKSNARWPPFFARQLEDGGFNIYLNGPSEINASIKAYFALKVAGISPR